METNKLKQICGTLLQANGLTTKTQKGQTFVYAFWHGVLAAQDNQNTYAYIQILLMSGRYDDLIA